MVPEYLLKRGAPGKRGEKEGRGRGKKKGKKKKKKGKGGTFPRDHWHCRPGTQFESLECFFFSRTYLDLEKEDTRCDVTMADQHRGERAQARKVIEYVSGGLGS